MRELRRPPRCHGAVSSLRRACPRRPGSERLFGLLLFEAEETLARGAPKSPSSWPRRAVKERPDSLTARSLLERARGEMLRGRRREKLEAKVVQAQGLLERGDWPAAEKIVTSALKLIPDHPVALDLFGKIRDLKLRPGTAEAEAEGELLLLARAQAQKAAEAARSALAAGWNRQAFFHVRRGLRQVPDHPELLALLHETQGSLEQIAAERARRRALVAQVRAGLELLAARDFEGSLRILRAVLAEDPDNPRAQAAIQEVRRIWLEQGGTPPPVGRPQPALAPMVAGLPVAAPPPAPRPSPQRAMPAPAPVPASIPGEILLPRTLRRATPVGVILLGAVALLAIVAVIIDRSSRAPVEPTPSATISPAMTPSTAVAAPTTTAPPGPLTEVDPALKTAVEATLSAYARALERADAALLATARPDLTPREREARRAPFVGALNAAADIRVIEAEAQGNEASITVLSTYIIVDGHEAPSGPIEETLRFVRRGGRGPSGTAERESPDVGRRLARRRQDLHPGVPGGDGAPRPHALGGRGRGGRDHGAVRLGQVHAARYPRAAWTGRRAGEYRLDGQLVSALDDDRSLPHPQPAASASSSSRST